MKICQERFCSPILTPRCFRLIYICGLLTTVLFLSKLYMVVEDYAHSGIFRNLFVGYFRPKPIILLWTPYFSKVHWLPPLKSLGCAMDCHITSNRTNLNESAAVIFHLRNVQIDDIPLHRSSEQKWVLLNHESPYHSPIEALRALEGKINWTVTYRLDSTFYAPYGEVVKSKFQPMTEVLKTSNIFSKPYFACWIVSHCNTSSHRESYIDVLSQYVPVTIYGKCGDSKCPNDTARDCYKHISPLCKFYLSFENSICKDYVTEKLFYALETEMVPVTFGGATYSQILPKKSFIDATRFPNPKDLADYLLQLNEHTDDYLGYHQWKTDHHVVDTSYKWACDVCRRLYDQQVSSSDNVDVHENLTSWWMDEAECSSWYNFSFYS